MYRGDEARLLARQGNGSEFDVTDPVYRQAAEAGLDDVATMQLVDVNTWLPGDILVKADRMAMAHGLELRTPFLDREVLAVAARLARVEKTAAGTTKFALREAISELLPQAAAERPKLGFPVPLGHWLRGGMYGFAEQVVRTAQTGQWLNKGAALDILRGFRSGDPGVTWRQVWLLVVFSLWHQIYVERVYDPVTLGPGVGGRVPGPPDDRSPRNEPLITPRISVVVAFFNNEDDLGDCLDSIAAQSFADLEVIMVDDGSTDHSAQIARAKAAADPRFTLLQPGHGGPGGARNRGVERARGEFLAFVDGDDMLPANAYELMLHALERSGSDFVSGAVYRVGPKGINPSALHSLALKGRQTGTHITRTPRLLYDVSVWNKLFRRSFWDSRELSYPEGVVWEDIRLMTKAHVLARAVDVIPDIVLLLARAHAGSAVDHAEPHQRRQPA